MIILSFNEIKAINIENEIQISILKGDIGSEVSRTKLEEQMHFDSIEYHPENSKIQKTLYPYFQFAGKVQIQNVWRDDEGITEEVVQFALDLGKDYKEVATVTHDSNSLTITHDANDSKLTGWTDRSLGWELVCDRSQIKSLTDDTVIACLVTKNPYKDWDYKSTNLNPSEEIDITHDGTLTYLLAGSDCEATIPVEGQDDRVVKINQYDPVKLKSSSLKLKNTSDSKCLIIRVEKRNS